MAAPQTESTVQMKQVAPLLVSAGVGRHPDVKDIYLLQVTDSSLVSKTWDGRSFTGEAELIASDIRPGSSAVYLLHPSSRYVIAISSSSTLRGIKYDEDEEEWVDDSVFPSIPVHPDSQLTAAPDAQGALAIFFQNASGDLQVFPFGASQTPTTIHSASPVKGSPLFAWPKDDRMDVYYVSAADHSVHYVTKAAGDSWLDASLAPAKLKETPKNFVFLNDAESGKEQVFALTPSSDMVSIQAEGSEVQALGKVEEGGIFVPKVSTECGAASCFPVFPKSGYPWIRDPMYELYRSGRIVA